MANENKGYKALDGKYYDSWWDRGIANDRVRNEFEQKQLLRQQNEQLRIQSQIQASNAVLQATQEMLRLQQESKLEQERQEHENKLEQERHEHEREILLLKICDELSIPLGIYKKFEEKLFSLDKEDEILLSNQMTYINSLLEDYNEKRLKLLTEVIKKNSNYPNNEVNYSSKYKKFEDLVNKKRSITEFEVTDFDIINNNQELVKNFSNINNCLKQYKGIYVFLKYLNLIIGATIIISSIIFYKIFYDMMLFMFVAASIPLAIGIFYNPVKLNENYEKSLLKNSKLLEELNKAINEQMKEDDANREPNEEDEKLLEEMNLFTQKSKEIQEKAKESTDKRLKELYDFRLNHYNMRIEKFFYDVGLVDECNKNGNNWLDIDKKDIVKEGSYEDYFHYFNTYNPSSKN